MLRPLRISDPQKAALKRISTIHALCRIGRFGLKAGFRGGRHERLQCVRVFQPTSTEKGEPWSHGSPFSSRRLPLARRLGDQGEPRARGCCQTNENSHQIAGAA